MYFEELCKAFARMEEVDAIALGGSRAGTNYDKKSDYDLYIYCSRVPDDGIRKEILVKYCQYMEIGNHFWELEDDCTLKDGVDIDILYRSLSAFEQDVASVVENHIAHNGYTTCMWHNIENSQILYDKEARLADIKKRFAVSYPKELKENIIKQNMRLLTGNLPSYDAQIKKAISRRDLVSVNHRTAAFLESYFDIIFAMNELTHPGEKRMVQYAQNNAKLLPENFEENINKLLKNLFSLENEENVSIILKDMTQKLSEVLKSNKLDF